MFSLLQVEVVLKQASNKQLSFMRLLSITVVMSVQRCIVGTSVPTFDILQIVFILPLGQISSFCWFSRWFRKRQESHL